MPHGKQQGVVLLGVLVAITCIAVLMQKAEINLTTSIRREHERQLLFAGEQIKHAIAAYYAASPGGGVYPKTLQDLLNDTRFPQPRRFLRRLYLDPMTGRPDWGLVTGLDERIMGVYSKGQGKPLKQSDFPKEFEDFEHKTSYRDWTFAVNSP